MAVTAAVSVGRQGETPTPSLAVQVGLLAGPFLTMVDSNIVNVALPSTSHQRRWSMNGWSLSTSSRWPRLQECEDAPPYSLVNS